MWRSATPKNLTMISGEIYSKSDRIVSLGRNADKRIFVKTRVARRTPKKYVCNAQGKFVSRSAILGFMNGDSRNRYNGTNSLGKWFDGYEDDGIDDDICKQSALYVGTYGGNGLPGAMVAELGFYQGVGQNSLEFLQGAEYVKQFKGGDKNVVGHLIDMLYPTKLLPNTDIVVEYETTSTCSIVDLADKEFIYELSLLLKPELMEYKNILRAEESKPSLLKFKEGLLKEHAFDIFKSDASKPVQMNTVMDSELYTFTQPIGNILLRNGYAIKFPSARRPLIAHDDYLEGAYNIALPMTPGQLLSLEPTALTWVEPTPKLPKVVKMSKRNGVNLDDIIISPMKI